MSLDPEEHPSRGPVIRDRRRIDPETGEVRERPGAAPAPPGSGGAVPPSVEAAAVEAELAERTADLQRLQAEYLNYKRRVDRDREHARTTAVAATLAALLPVLDDIARARDHGELTGGFKAVADSFERTVAQLGLTTYGEVGDAFDPRIHEALMHSYADDVDGPTCQAILQVGYRIGERILRPARVAVAEPTPAPAPAPPTVPADDRPEAGADPFGFGLEGDAADGSSYSDDDDGDDDNDDNGSADTASGREA